MSRLDEFVKSTDAESLTELERARLLLWFLLRGNEADVVSMPEIVQAFQESGLGSPNASRLKGRLLRDKNVINRSTRDNPMFTLSSVLLEELDIVYADFVHDQKPILRPISARLLDETSLILDAQVAGFVQEGIGCLNGGYYRAAVVLLWVGAMALIESYILRNKLTEYNQAGVARKLLQKPVAAAEDFQRIKEADKLLLAEASGVISKSVRSALVECLNRRNNCGHPNDVHIGESQVAAHVESLIHHVFLRFK